MIYFYCTSWQFFQMIVKWRISPTTEQIMFTFSILFFHFYSHIPYGMWRIPKLKHFVLLRFLLTHPVWDVTGIPTDITPVWTNFYSHIPCGMWHGMGGHSHSISEFLLTHPVWDVTIHGRWAEICNRISTHTSRVGCDWVTHLTMPIWWQISTHTSRVGCDVALTNILRLTKISTHTSRVGCDQKQLALPDACKHFYSHIPCGMWLRRHNNNMPKPWFLLTHPVWDVTPILPDS